MSLQSSVGIYSIRDMEIYINKNFGDKVSWSGKQKSLTKFGSNPDVGTSFEDVWGTGGIESLPSDNLITHIASSSGSDTQTMIVEGHVIDGNANLTFIIQTVTLVGQTKTAFSTPLARCTRVYTTGSVSLVGTVRVARDVTFTAGVPASDIHATVLPSNNQTQKSSTSVSQSDYWMASQITVSVRRQQTRSVDFFFQIKETNGVWRTRLQPISSSNVSGTVVVPLPEVLIIKPNSDFRIQAISSGTGTEVGAALYGTLFIKESEL